MTENEFDTMVFENQGIIWKVCKTYFRNEEDQKDLFQDILYKLWRGRDQFHGHSKISTWIYRVSLNQAIDKSRKMKRKPENISDDGVQNLQSKINKQSEYDIQALYLAIGHLAPVEKALILLYLEQQTYKEMAQIVGISEKNVSVKLVRIKEKLKKYYLNITQQL